MDALEAIKEIDIAEYISQFVDLELKNGEWWGLSPFKDEMTPSFSVRNEGNSKCGTWYDFSSGKGGNIIEFVRLYNKCSVPEAIDILKKYCGDNGISVTSTGRLASTDVIKKFARRVVAKKDSVVKVLPKDYMNRYEQRDDKLQIWFDEGISKQSIDRFQVRYDSYSNRIVYPIRNIEGDIVNIGGRALDKDWKEKGYRKYCYFYPWGQLNTIYGFAENLEYIKKAGEIILFEGCKSVLIADTWDIKNTGAILTSHLNENQMKILAKLGCRVVFALDKDVNIKEDKNIDRLKQYVNISYIKDYKGLLDEKDSPVDKGKETFNELYKNKFKL